MPTCSLGSPSSAGPRCRRRCSSLGLRGVAHRAGLRAHRGRPERALPAAGGRPAQAGFAGSPTPTSTCDPVGRERAAGERAERLSGLLAQPRRRRRAPSATAGCCTGDVAERDGEGNYRIRGRLKDMIVSGGENVYPAEIEATLHDHPAVADAAVVGVPDERWGEVCPAFVVVESDASPRRSCPALPEQPGALQGAEVVRVRRRAAPQLDEQDPEVRVEGGGVTSSRHERRRPATFNAGARTRVACSTRPRRSSASWVPGGSIVKVAEAAGVGRAPSTSTSTRRRTSSTSS